MFSSSELIEILDEEIGKKRRVIAAHGAGSKDPWAPEKIDEIRRNMEAFKFMRDRLHERQAA